MASLSEIQVDVRRQLGLSDTDAVVSDEVLAWAINQALKTISTDKDWPWLYTEQTFDTTDATASYALPSGYTRSAFITVDGGSPIEPSTRVSQAGDRVTAGAPNSYVVEGTTLRLYPTPNSVTPVVHAHYRAEPELVIDTDAPLLPDAYTNWLVLEAAVLVAIRTNNLSRLQTLRDEAARVRSGIVDNYRRSHAPGRIRKTRTSTWPTIW